MNSGAEAIVRVPFPNAGPRRLTTASEVATMEFVRSRFGFPVPKVYAWDGSCDNAVGWEYLIMEKCSGDKFDTHVDQVDQSAHIIHSLAKLQHDMSEIKFSQFGSIYFKEDVDVSLQSRPLYAPGVPDDECSKRFRIGPSVERQFYRGERARKDLDRGPWYDAESYIRAFSNGEMQWLRAFGASPGPQIQNGAHHTPASHLESLKKWLRLLPAVLPTQATHSRPTLSHPDLSGSNILVSNLHSKLAISGIIDWQGASIRPLFDIFSPPFLMTRPDEVRQISIQLGNEDASVSGEVSGQKVLTGRYVNSVFRLSPLLYDVLSSSHFEKLRAGKYYSSHSWSDGLPLLNDALIAICDGYGQDIPLHIDYSSCPISFTPGEREKNEADLKFHHQDAILENLADRMLAESGIVWQEDGNVPADQILDAREVLKNLYDKGAKALSGERLHTFNRAWPYRKGKFTLTSEVCM